MTASCTSNGVQINHRVISALALGDSLGLPFENLKPAHVSRILDKSDITQITLSNGAALVSDDTEHALLTVLALDEAEGSSDLFEQSLARHLANWCRACPPGIGGATLKSCLKLILGVSASKSGVLSAGNGPLMRVPVIALKYRGHSETRKAFVKISTRMTHTDPRATAMSLFLSEVMVLASEKDLTWEDVRSCFIEVLEDCPISEKYAAEMQSKMVAIGAYDPCTATPQDAMKSIGCAKGVSGYILPSAIAAIWFSIKAQGDVGEALRLSIEAGGDTDSVAAIACALTACSPFAVMPRGNIKPFAGAWAGGNRIPQYAAILSAVDNSSPEMIAAPPVGEQFKDNMRAFFAMMRHILWRRLF